MSKPNDVITLSVCPRCQNICNMQFPALSRRDKKTAICSNCGTDEAMREYLNLLPKEF